MSMQGPGPDPGRAAPASLSYINLVVGVWVFISAFLWPHTFAMRTDTWIVGALIVLFSLLAMTTPPLRFVNTALAVWLFVTTLAFPHVRLGTLWSNIIASIIVFVVSLSYSAYPNLGSGTRSRL